MAHSNIIYSSIYIQKITICISHAPSNQKLVVRISRVHASLHTPFVCACGECAKGRKGISTTNALFTLNALDACGVVCVVNGRILIQFLAA